MDDGDGDCDTVNVGVGGVRVDDTVNVELFDIATATNRSHRKRFPLERQT